MKLNPQNIDPHAYKNPRQFFDAVELGKLKASIKENGQEQPIVICKHPNPESKLPWAVLAGWRRYTACSDLGIDVLAEARETPKDARQAAIIAGIENILRSDLTPPELCNYIGDLAEGEGALKPADIAKHLQLSYQSVTNYLRVRRSPVWDLWWKDAEKKGPAPTFGELLTVMGAVKTKDEKKRAEELTSAYLDVRGERRAKREANVKAGKPEGKRTRSGGKTSTQVGHKIGAVREASKKTLEDVYQDLSPGVRTSERDYLQGVFDALAWVTKKGPEPAVTLKDAKK